MESKDLSLSAGAPAIREVPRLRSTRKTRSAPLSRIHAVGSVFLRGFHGDWATALQWGDGAQNLFPDLLPPTAFGRGDAELEGGHALGAADDPGAVEEPVAQRADAQALQPPEVAAEEQGEVVGEDAQRERGFGGEELLAAQAGQAEAAAQFFDDALPAPSGAALRAKAPPFGYLAPLGSMPARPW